MTDDKVDTDSARLHISMGSDVVEISGSEEFVSNQLTTILDRLELGSGYESGEEGMEEENRQETMGSFIETQSDNSESTDDNDTSGSQEETTIEDVANKINVPAENLKEYFYIDDGEIHIQNPRMEPKYALLGYCTLREEIHGDIYHNNPETKKKLIDVEKVDISDWGGTLLYNLRKSGYVKDDPNTSKSRFKPFKITPQGRRLLEDWLNEDN
jgi:hypothetical protein